jgi:hypothetical protein
MGSGYFLSLKDGVEGAGYHLQGSPLRPGDDIELLLEGGVWILGRFGWSGRPDESPTLHLTCGGAWEELADPESATYPIPPEITFPLPRGALLRWPRTQPSVPPGSPP